MAGFISGLFQVLDKWFSRDNKWFTNISHNINNICFHVSQEESVLSNVSWKINKDNSNSYIILIFIQKWYFKKRDSTIERQ